MNTARIQDNGQVTIPSAVRRKAGLSKGDLLDFTVKGGKIVITPKIVGQRTGLPTADDDYTPRQRRVVDTRLNKAEQDVKVGRVSRAFTTAEEFLADLHKATAKVTSKKHKRSSE